MRAVSTNEICLLLILTALDRNCYPPVDLSCKDVWIVNRVNCLPEFVSRKKKLNPHVTVWQNCYVVFSHGPYFSKQWYQQWYFECRTHNIDLPHNCHTIIFCIITLQKIKKTTFWRKRTNVFFEVDSSYNLDKIICILLQVTKYRVSFVQHELRLIWFDNCLSGIP